MRTSPLFDEQMSEQPFLEELFGRHGFVLTSVGPGHLPDYLVEAAPRDRPTAERMGRGPAIQRFEFEHARVEDVVRFCRAHSSSRPPVTFAEDSHANAVWFYAASHDIPDIRSLLERLDVRLERGARRKRD